MLDKARLEDCAETLEELLKRSNAIHEIRAKVILYKEFLKVLYENEPLSEQRLTEKSVQAGRKTKKDLMKGLRFGYGKT